VLRALKAPPIPVPDAACNNCLSCHKPFNSVRWPHSCSLCARLLCSACSSLRAPAAAFPPAFVQTNSSPEKSSSSGGSLVALLSTPAAAANGAESRTDVIQVEQGSLKNPVCEDCHAVLSVSSSVPRGSPQQPPVRLQGLALRAH
jgi:hypothetical protein